MSVTGNTFNRMPSDMAVFQLFPLLGLGKDLSATAQVNRATFTAYSRFLRSDRPR